jgi:hypothetical protein
MHFCRAPSFVAILLIALSCCFTPCEANLGDTPEQIKSRYASPVEKFGTDTDKTFRFRRPGRDLDTVDVTFQKGKCVREAYHHWKSKTLDTIDSTGAYPRTEVESILKANAQGLTWRIQAPAPANFHESTVWLLGSNNPKTALARAFENTENHSLVMEMLSWDRDATTDSATAAALDKLFPTPAKTREPVQTEVQKSNNFPLARVIGQPQSTVNKIFGNPVNHHPIHPPDKLAGGTEASYADGGGWTLLDTAFYRGKLSWVEFFFKPNLPKSEEEFFSVLGLSKKDFTTTANTSESAWDNAHTRYRGIVNKHLIEIDASHPGPRDGIGFCHKVDIDLIDTLN